MGWRKRGGGGLIFRITMRPSTMKATHTMTINSPMLAVMQICVAALNTIAPSENVLQFGINKVGMRFVARGVTSKPLPRRDPPDMTCFMPVDE